MQAQCCAVNHNDFTSGENVRSTTNLAFQCLYPNIEHGPRELCLAGRVEIHHSLGIGAHKLIPE